VPYGRRRPRLVQRHDVDIAGGPAEQAGGGAGVPVERHRAGGAERGQVGQPRGVAPAAMAGESTMTGLVDRAEKRGLLQRAPSTNDGRAVDVFLSPEGAELAGRLSTHIARTLSPMTSRLAPPEQRLLQTLLEQMLSPDDS
jgi:hypothetical protein